MWLRTAEKFENFCDPSIEEHKRKLFNQLIYFLDVHNVKNKEIRKAILKTFVKDASFCIANSFHWDATKEGYNFYFFLNLRWISQLIINQNLYAWIGDKRKLLGNMKNFLTYSQYGSDRETRDLFVKKKERFCTIYKTLKNKI